MRLTVDVDDRLLDEVKQRLGDFPKKAPNLISRALNRAATNINSNIKRETREEYHIKASDIKDSINPIRRATRSSLLAEVRSNGAVIGLEKFKVTPRTINPNRKSPVKVAVKKGTPKPIDGAFMAEVNGPKLFKRVGKKRLPIARLFGPSLPQMIENGAIRERIEKQGQETFRNRLDHEIERELGRGNKI